VGFVGRRSIAAVVSNCTDIHSSRIWPASGHLAYSFIRPKETYVKIAGDIEAVLPEEIKRLKTMLRKNFGSRDVENAMAEINAAVATRTTTVSRQCVTGSLLASGSAAVVPHSIDEGREYLPEFVKRHLAANGILGYKHKFDEDGNTLLPRWVQMAAKVQGGRGKYANIVVGYEIANVGDLIGGGVKPKNSAVASKVAGENEPRSYTVRFNWNHI
jgi:hypothetical protein